MGHWCSLCPIVCTGKEQHHQRLSCTTLARGSNLPSKGKKIDMLRHKNQCLILCTDSNSDNLTDLNQNHVKILLFHVQKYSHKLHGW